MQNDAMGGISLMYGAPTDSGASLAELGPLDLDALRGGQVGILHRRQSGRVCEDVPEFIRQAGFHQKRQLAAEGVHVIRLVRLDGRQNLLARPS